MSVYRLTRRNWLRLAAAAATGRTAGAVLANSLAPTRDGPRHGFPAPAGVGGPFDLVDQHGQRFGLERLAGRPALLFFGFLHCGSACPLALATARQVLAEAPAATAPAVVFVSLDPLSDTPKLLGEHLARIDPRLIGLTGDPARVYAVAERYGVATRARETGLDHSAMWYLLDSRGLTRRVYRHTTPAAQLLDDLRALGSERGTSPETAL